MAPIKGMTDLNKLKSLGKTEVKDINAVIANNFRNSFLTISAVNESSGYSYEITTLTPADINRWRTSMYSGSMLTERFMVYKTIYDKLLSTSLDITNKISVVDFEKNTLIVDVENMLYAMYLATFPENTEIPLICNNPITSKNTEKVDPVAADESNITTGEFISNLLQNKLNAQEHTDTKQEEPAEEEPAEEKESGFSPTKICKHRTKINLKAHDIIVNKIMGNVEEYFNDLSKTGILKNHRLVFDINNGNTIITLSLPTIAKQKAIYGNVDDEKLFEDYGEILLSLLYIEKIKFIVKDEEGNEKLTEDIVDDNAIFDIVSNKVSPDDFNIIISNVNALASAFQVSFKLPEYKCKKCGGKIGDIVIPSMEELFQRRLIQNRQ